MRIVPLTLRQANELVRIQHRHNLPLKSLLSFGIGLEDHGHIIGAVIVGRPISVSYCDGYTLEVKRLVTFGAKNACSMLYGAAWRAARALGYSRMVTYTLFSESGASLRASNWKEDGVTSGGTLKTNYATGEREHIESEIKRRWIVEATDRDTTKNPIVFDVTHGKSNSAPLLFPICECGDGVTTARPLFQEEGGGLTPLPRIEGVSLNTDRSIR